MFSASQHTRIRAFPRSQSGVVAIPFALSTFVAIGVVGMAIDYSFALSAKTQLQFVVDQSAIAGASLPATANQNRIVAAKNNFQANIGGSKIKTSTQTVNASNAGVTVTGNYTYDTILLKAWRVNQIPLRARSGARSQVQNGGVACLIALNPTTDNGLHLQGVNKLTSPNCWAWVNSTHSNSINAVGASLGSAQGFCTAGGVLGGDHFQPAPFTGCDPIEDPFAAKVVPADGTCMAGNGLYGKGTHTFQPGTYCNGIVLKPQAVATFQPGAYIIKGLFEIQGQSEATGSGVVFVFKGANAKLIVRGGGKIDVKAPAEAATNVGNLQGFVFFQDKNTTPAGGTTIIQGGGRVKMEGVLYMPTWRVDIGGNGDVNQDAKYFAMVADSFYMEGNGKLYVTSDASTAGLPNLMPRIKNGPTLTE